MTILLGVLIIYSTCKILDFLEKGFFNLMTLITILVESKVKELSKDVNDLKNREIYGLMNDESKKEIEELEADVNNIMNRLNDIAKKWRDE